MRSSFVTAASSSGCEAPKGWAAVSMPGKPPGVYRSCEPFTLARPSELAQIADVRVEDTARHVHKVIELLVAKPVVDRAAFLSRVDHVLHPQDGQLLRYGRSLDTECRHQLAHALLAVPEQLQYPDSHR